MWLAFQVVACVVLVILVGTWLSRSADILAEKTGLGRTWVGAILLAGATSLPELATGMSAVTVFQSPDLAAGGIFGSCLFNLFILALLDMASGPGPLFHRVQISHGLAAALGCILLGIAATSTLLAGTGKAVTLGWIGVPSLVLLLLYLISARLIARFEMRRRIEVQEQEAEMYQYNHIKAWQAYALFGVLAAAIVVLGVWLAALGDQIAIETGLGESFVGALLLAAATSLPEVVASLAALRLKALDLAVSNIFGSNIFNLAILALYDMAYLQGDFWAAISQVHVFTAIVAMTMTSVAVVGLIYRANGRSRFYISWDALTLIALYIGGMYVIFQG